MTPPGDADHSLAVLMAGMKRLSEVCLRLQERLERLEQDTLAISDLNLSGRHPPPDPALLDPDQGSQSVIPALDLGLEQLVEVYANTPQLLAPFSRPCGLSPRTVRGEAQGIELETCVGGSWWCLQLKAGELVLVPRPGVLWRSLQLGSLQRVFELRGPMDPPLALQLERPARLVAVQHGRRWLLHEPGLLSAMDQPPADPLRERLRRLEARLDALEAADRGTPPPQAG